MRQNTEDGCGAIVLRTILAHLHHDRAYLYVPLKGAWPLSLGEMSENAAEHGVGIVWKRADCKEELLACPAFPLILSLHGKKRSHLVIAYGRKAGRFRVFDPAEGRKRIRSEILLERWDGVFGEARLVNERTGDRRWRKPLAHNGKLVLPVVLETVSLALSILGLSFMDERYPFFLSFLVLGLALAFSFLRIIASFCALRSYDKDMEVASGLTVEEKLRGKEVFLGPVLSFCSAFLVSLALIVLFGMNDVAFLLGALLLSALLLLGHLLSKGRFEKTLNDIRETERRSILGNDAKLLEAVNEKSYRFGFRYALCAGAYAVIIFLFAVWMALTREEFHLDRLLFDFVLLFGYAESLRKVLRSGNELKRRKRELGALREKMTMIEK